MDIRKLGRQVNANLKYEDLEILEKLNDKGITITDIFRRGLRAYQEDSVDDVTQNNVA